MREIVKEVSGYVLANISQEQEIEIEGWAMMGISMLRSYDWNILSQNMWIWDSTPSSGEGRRHY